jgi:regulator of RNase E activity RraB
MRMSDEWKFFLCQVGDHMASIMVDVGISEGIEHAPPNLATIFLDYQQADERGMPTGAEFDAVAALEDELQSFVDKGRDVFVGRITKEGQRIFFVYTMRDEARWAPYVEALSAKTGYALRLHHEADPEHAKYWKYLYPTADDWQVIKDMEVVERLEENGDDPGAEHTIEHFAYFRDEESAGKFVAWAVGDRFTHLADEGGWNDDKQFCVRLDHVGPSDSRSISSHTLALRRKAAEFGGEYDGWGTSIVKKGE